MGQRKLTREELQHVEKAAWYLQYVIKQCGLIRGGGVVLVDYLNEIAAHGTTDGNPYVEPQPEVGDGYRVATESDAWRRDVEYFSNLKGNGWFARAVHGKPLESSYHYRVPVDRIPTDEDAVGRPIVMVRDADPQEWLPRPLLAVYSKHPLPFVISSSDGFTTWKQARFPYPGELD
jgi:hypothetical protein